MSTGADSRVVGTERRLGTAKSQQASDQMLWFNISNQSRRLGPPWGYYGILHPLTNSLWLTAICNDWHEEPAACWERGRQINCLPYSWLMVGLQKKRQSPPSFLFCGLTRNDDSCSSVLAEMHEVDSSPPPPPWVWGFFFAFYKYCLFLTKAEIRIRERLLNKAFQRLNYWTEKRCIPAAKQQGLMVFFWTQQQNQSCIKLCVPVICSSLRRRTGRFFETRWLNNGFCIARLTYACTPSPLQSQTWQKRRLLGKVLCSRLLNWKPLKVLPVKYIVKELASLHSAQLPRGRFPWDSPCIVHAE